ncbi:MAG TPA: QsdR family transcriptional regulator [Solirubrobacterales bacterium]|nr:QsdR family transcriptional regulator [Solirubrobacterales bacterium]
MNLPVTSAKTRSTPEDAVRLARQHYLACERVDMQSLAAELGIGRTTLYRWVGDRESLISGMLAAMVAEVIADSVEQAEGEDLERVIDGMKRFSETSAGFRPLRHLVRTEPELGLRVMMAPGSGVSVAICDALRVQLELTRPDWAGEKAGELADVVTQIGMAYVWVNIANDSEPDIDRATRAMRLLLTAADRP